MTMQLSSLRSGAAGIASARPGVAPYGHTGIAPCGHTDGEPLPLTLPRRLAHRAGAVRAYRDTPLRPADGAAARASTTRPAHSPRTMTRLLSLLALVALLAGCGDRPGADGDATAADSLDTSVPVEVLIAETGVFEDVIELTGSVESPNDATLSPDVPGALDRRAHV